MRRISNKLSARSVASAKPGRHGDGGGLYLIVQPSGSKKWVLRFSFGGRVTETGLGSASDVSLAEARERGLDARRLIKNGINPIESKRAKKFGSCTPTFGVVADRYLAAKNPSWRSEKHRQQWRHSLDKLAEPIRNTAIDEVDTATLLAVLQPIWRVKPETASRLRGRIEAVLDAAKAQGLRSGENPAAWRGHLMHLLPGKSRLARGHHAALPYQDVPAFLHRLRQTDAIAAIALTFCIMTAARSGEVFGARWSEVDFSTAVWTVPAARMKMGRLHRVPLSTRCVDLLVGLRTLVDGEYIFPSPRGDRPLSHVAMAKVVRRLGCKTATVHGFRSAFRDWAGNETTYPREIAEAALSHVVGDKAEQAYRRSDALEKRRAMMEAWAQFCSVADETNVIAFYRKQIS